MANRNELPAPTSMKLAKLEKIVRDYGFDVVNKILTDPKTGKPVRNDRKQPVTVGSHKTGEIEKGHVRAVFVAMATHSLA